MLKNRKVNLEKLISYGFTQTNDNYTYQTEIMNGQFWMKVTVAAGEISTKVIDITTEDEYVLHLADTMQGAFVGQVRDAYNEVLDDIIDKCTDVEIFKVEQTKIVIDYIQNHYGDKIEFLWEKFPKNAVFRSSNTQKWYAAILTVEKNKLGLVGEEAVEVLDLHLPVEKVEQIVDNKKFFPGYHMNKKHWITVCLDGTVSNEEIKQLIKESYRLA